MDTIHVASRRVSTPIASPRFWVRDFSSGRSDISWIVGSANVVCTSRSDPDRLHARSAAADRVQRAGRAMLPRAQRRAPAASQQKPDPRRNGAHGGRFGGIGSVFERRRRLHRPDVLDKSPRFCRLPPLARRRVCRERELVEPSFLQPRGKHHGSKHKDALVRAGERSGDGMRLRLRHRQRCRGRRLRRND